MFVAFEGLDGSGKTSLIRELSSNLSARSIGFITTREPGGTELGDEIRELLLRTQGDTPTPRTELLLYEAIRAQHVSRLIEPALQEKKWVLCDRFSASTVAFQCGGRGLSQQDVDWLNHYATAGLQPDLTVLLDLPVETSFERQKKRSQHTGIAQDRFESEKMDFHQRVRTSYLQQAERQEKTWLILDSTQPTKKLSQLLHNELEKRGWLL